MMGNTFEVTDANFSQEVLNADKPVLVDFWAEWCGPCRMVAPVVEEIAQEHDNIKVCKLDVDNNQYTAAQYGVMSIPTLILFENGQEKERVVGYMPKAQLVSKLGIA
ncbi:MAG TPA: thioredoxin [Halanaerobiales bacterium]|jgi:thioredoxin 1|nr:thioredoxin [Halanaerobiales bacterium]HPZ62429.1 thioredoxin [Halanaerobiales bacterium]HQD03689.1 thioredoxin [Halanaerobiales bacterium]